MIKIKCVIYTLWNTFQNHPIIFQKAFSNVFKIVPTNLEIKALHSFLRQTVHHLDSDSEKIFAYYNKKGEEKFHIPNF